jgi:hypothetical protein
MGKAEKDVKDQKDLMDGDGTMVEGFGGTANGTPETGALPKAEVSPGAEWLRHRVFEAPGFRRAESVGDTKYVFCVILSSILLLNRCVYTFFMSD